MLRVKHISANASTQTLVVEKDIIMRNLNRMSTPLFITYLAIWKRDRLALKCFVDVRSKEEIEAVTRNIEIHQGFIDAIESILDSRK